MVRESWKGVGSEIFNLAYNTVMSNCALCQAKREGVLSTWSL